MTSYLRPFLITYLVVTGLFVHAATLTAQEKIPAPKADQESTQNTWNDEPITGKKPIDLSDTSFFSTQLTQTLISLGFVILVMFAVAWGLKRVLNQRMVQMNTSSTIKIVERRGLSPKSALYLIESKGNMVLIGESAAGLVKLMELNPKSADVPTNFEGVYNKRETTDENH